MFSMDHRTLLEQDFAVVDPLQTDASLWSHLPAKPLGDEQFDCDTTKLPHLLCLRNVDELVRIELLDVCEAFTAGEGAAFFCALIRTKESESSLARRLSSRMVLARKSNGLKYFFRYFDPRVFLHLPRILTDVQMSTLLAPATAWVWRDPTAQRWQEHQIVASVSEARVTPPLSLDDKQIDSIARIELVNRVLRRLQPEQGEQAHAPSMTLAIDSHALRAIETERLVSVDDQAQFVLDAIKYGAQVHEALAVRHILDNTRNNEVSYVSGMSALGEQGILAAMKSSRSHASS